MSMWWGGLGAGCGLPVLGGTDIHGRGERAREAAEGDLSTPRGLGRDGISGAATHLPQDAASAENITEMPQGRWPCKVWSCLEMTRLLPLTFGKPDSPSVRSILPKQQKEVGFVLNRRKKIKNLEMFATSPIFPQRGIAPK